MRHLVANPVRLLPAGLHLPNRDNEIAGEKGVVFPQSQLAQLLFRSSMHHRSPKRGREMAGRRRESEESLN